MIERVILNFAELQIELRAVVELAGPQPTQITHNLSYLTTYLQSTTLMGVLERMSTPLYY